MLFVVKSPNGKLIGLCDQDVKKMYEECYAIMAAGDHSKAALIDVYTYAGMLRGEYISRFGKTPAEDHLMDFGIEGVPAFPNGKKYEIPYITVEEYIGMAAGYASWECREKIPHWWGRSRGKGRRFCPLPDKLTNQQPIPMENKEDEKEKLGKTAAQYHREISHRMKSFGVKPFNRVIIEKWMIKGVTNIDQRVEDAIKAKPDFSKALQYRLEKEAETKITLNVLRKGIKMGYNNIVEILRKEAGILEPKPYVDSTVQLFHNNGFNNPLTKE